MDSAHLQRTEHHSIWNACREAEQAAAFREAQELERLEAAALELGFAKNKGGAWAVTCPHCGYIVQLYCSQGQLRVTSLNPRCAVVPKLQAYLLRNGGRE